MSGRSTRYEIEIPPRQGRLFEVQDGDLVRIVALEGPQAADLVAFNTNDIRETLSTWLSRHMSGSFLHARELYTKLPAARVMFEVVTNEPGLLWLSPGRCNRMSYRETGEPHLNCQEILEGLVEQLNLNSFDVPEVLNIFMKAEMNADGTYEFRPSPVESGDAFEMVARMDATIAISACPDDLNAYNEFQTRSLGVQVLGPRAA